MLTEVKYQINLFSQISVARELGVQARVVLSRMDEPLGTTAGNSLEVLESVQCLTGTMSPDIRKLVSVLGVLYQTSVIYTICSQAMGIQVHTCRVVGRTAS